MKKIQKDKSLIIVLLSMLFLILFTRCATIRHGIFTHPDEVVFYKSATSIFNPETGYSCYMPYPEGTFILQILFQLFAKLVTYITHRNISPSIAGRLFSIFCFSFGSLLSAVLVYRLSEKRIRPVIFYALLMTFSMFQLEQSRYGTGDPPSFAVFVLMIYTLYLFLSKPEPKLLYLCVPFFLCGCLAAIKYPQIYFSLIPLTAVIMRCREKKAFFIKSIAIAIPIIFLGFIAISPSMIKDPLFIKKVCERELYNYMENPSYDGVGTPASHIASILIYRFLYSDIVFSPVFVFCGIITGVKKCPDGGEKSLLSKFFFTVLPVYLFIFLSYNMFVKALFFRTLCIYFCMCIMYAAIGLDATFSSDKHWIRRSVCVAMCLIILFGSMLIFAMTRRQDRANELTEMIEQNENWKSSSNRSLYFIDPDLYFDGDPYRVLNIATELIPCYSDDPNPYPQLHPGDFAITGSVEYRLNRRLFGTNNAIVDNTFQAWSVFKALNEKYFLAETYPKELYYLFGYWVHGSTGGMYEFPHNSLYCCPLENTVF